jgi:hypothetical protein
VAYNAIVKADDVWANFQQSSAELLKDLAIEESEVKKFCFEWTQKMIHARLGEFIKCHNMHQAEVAHKRIKGGQSLRDELFCVTKPTKMVTDDNVGEHLKNVTSKKSNSTFVSKTTKSQQEVKPSNSIPSCSVSNSVQTPSRKNRFCKSKKLNMQLDEQVPTCYSPVRKSRRLCKSNKQEMYNYE